MLLVCLGVLLLRLCERIGQWTRVGLTLLAFGCVVLIGFTLSRMALLGVVLVAGGAAQLAWRRAHGPDGGTPRWRILRPVTFTLLGLTVAALVLPGASRVNPLLRLLAPDPEATARADELRLALVEAGLRMWSTQPWIGVGGGRFETLLAQQAGGAGRMTPMHNSFVELLTEYGAVLAGVLVLTLTWLVVRLLRGGGGEPTHGAPAGLDRPGARYLLGVYLLGFGVAGVLVSSALPWTMWWLTIASATTTAWWLGVER